MISTPITASTAKEVLNEIKQTKCADLIELRLDFIRDITKSKLEELLKSP